MIKGGCRMMFEREAAGSTPHALSKRSRSLNLKLPDGGIH